VILFVLFELSLLDKLVSVDCRRNFVITLSACRFCIFPSFTAYFKGDCHLKSAMFGSTSRDGAKRPVVGLSAGTPTLKSTGTELYHLAV
jgi:hypothetical protein